jgi:hypothetical protein
MPRAARLAHQGESAADKAARHRLNRQQDQLRRHERERNPPLNGSDLTYRSTLDQLNAGGHQVHTLGSISVQCPNCHALHFAEERLTRSSKRNPQFGNCCSGGIVVLPSIGVNVDFPLLQALLRREHAQSLSFIDNLRHVNNVLSFTSLGINADATTWGPQGIYNLRITGELLHRIGSILPDEDQPARFAQIYTLDDEHAVAQRMNHFGGTGIQVEIIEELQAWLNTNNTYARTFKSAAERYQAQPDALAFRLRAVQREGTDVRRYNLPTISEVALAMPNDDESAGYGRDIVIQYKGGSLKRLNELSRMYFPLRYPLIHLHGEDGWHDGIPFAANQSAGDAIRGEALEGEVITGRNQRGRGGSTRVSQLQFFQWHIHTRPQQMSVLFYTGRLLQEYTLDMWVTVESNRLRFIRTNQSTIRAETYQGLADAVNTGLSAEHIGRQVILPSSFVGGNRHMAQLFQDAMALVRKLGAPSLFITITCNPRWDEIQRELLPGQTATDRPDLVARVFALKLDAINKEIFKQGVLGKCIAYVQVIEFQKRGLPHAHTLLIMDPADRPRTIEDVDRLVCAELPDPETDPIGHQVVASCMLHGPCGLEFPSAPCMKDGKCTKKYPKTFWEETLMAEDGYPNYRRRNNGRSVRRTMSGGRVFELRNDTVVPYNPYLSRRFNCHINVEVTTGIHCVKYIYKYVYKGHDRITVTMGSLEEPQARDETREYVDSR